MTPDLTDDVSPASRQGGSRQSAERTEAKIDAAAWIDGVDRDDEKPPGSAEHRVTDMPRGGLQTSLVSMVGAVSASDQHWPATWCVGRSRRPDMSCSSRGSPIAGPASLTKHTVRSTPPDRTSSSIRPHTARSTPIWNG